MHVDYAWSVKGDVSYACNAPWLLIDMTLSNGPTRIVPGSHRWGKLPTEGMSDVKCRHPQEVLIQAKAGDVLLVNSHVWHGGTINQSGEERTIVQSYFVHRACYPQQFHRYQIREETRNRLSPADLAVLDIH